MIPKRKNLITLALLFFSFICFSLNAHGYEPRNEMEIGYTVEPKGEGNLIRFGQISRWLQENHRRSAQERTSSRLGRLVTHICKENYATEVIFDNVEYVYDKSNAALTIIGHEGNLYATAQNFVIEGLNLTDNYAVNGEWAQGVSELTHTLMRENLPVQVTFNIAQYRINPHA